MPRLLSVLHAFIALNAIGGGWYGLAGAEGVPVAWLTGTPFATYRVPSLVLLMVVGGTQALASVKVWRLSHRAQLVSRAASVVLLGWIGAQLSMIGFVSWLQPAMIASAVVCLALAQFIPRATATR